MQSFNQQFGHPKGLMGRFVGAVMAIENRERNTWAVSRLDLQSTDTVLEIGFGPGLAIHEAAQLARLVAGIDQSEVMLGQAARRNRHLIQAGRVELRQGTSEQIPYPDQFFDKVFAINSFHHWSNPMAGLVEVLRVLKPGGMITIFEQPHRGDPQESKRETLRLLTEAGFKQINATEKAMKPTATICVKAIK